MMEPTWTVWAAGRFKQAVRPTLAAHRVPLHIRLHYSIDQDLGVDDQCVHSCMHTYIRNSTSGNACGTWGLTLRPNSLSAAALVSNSGSFAFFLPPPCIQSELLSCTALMVRHEYITLHALMVRHEYNTQSFEYAREYPFRAFTQQSHDDVCAPTITSPDLFGSHVQAFYCFGCV